MNSPNPHRTDPVRNDPPVPDFALTGHADTLTEQWRRLAAAHALCDVARVAVKDRQAADDEPGLPLSLERLLAETATIVDAVMDQLQAIEDALRKRGQALPDPRE